MTDGQQEHQLGWTDEEQIERALVLQVLRNDHDERWTRAELEAEVFDFDPWTRQRSAHPAGSRWHRDPRRRAGARVGARSAHRRTGADRHMSAATITNPGELVDELRRFEPVSDGVVLAAIDRAERHRGGRDEGARMSTLAEHLGFVHGPWTARGLRPQLDALIEAGALERVRRQGMVLLVLTGKGRRRAARARRTVALPESPQHRAWRQTRKKAVERIDGLREDARRAVQDAGRLLDVGEADSEALFLLAVRSRGASEGGVAVSRVGDVLREGVGRAGRHPRRYRR
jgi:hypothetical protein